jgi:hypothetical protein
MGSAAIRNFRFRGWRLAFTLARRGDLVDVGVSADGPATAALILRLPDGTRPRLGPGARVRFTVDPRRYFEAFGRSAHAPERAQVMSQVLLGTDAPAGFASMGARALEAFMVRTETDYVPRNP